ncbi:hypothetical protein MRX96_016083 [Rhipicephalus microplus]
MSLFLVSMKWSSTGLPATIDAVLNPTQQERFLYIGWLQASQVLLGLLSEKPKYNARLSGSGGLMVNTALTKLQAALVCGNDFTVDLCIAAVAVLNGINRNKLNVVSDA